MAASSKRAKEIIAKIEYVTIASVDSDGFPWNAPVFAAFDEQYNFYWGTYMDSQKARNIRNNPNVFLVIYDSTIGAGKGEGVYIKALASMITEASEVKRVLDMLIGRHNVEYWNLTDVANDGPVRLYKAIPQTVWMNDEGSKNGHYIDVRTEIKLSEA